MGVKPVTVLHLIDTPGPGGAEQVCAQIATGLDPERFRSIPVVVGEGWLSAHLRGQGMQARHIPQRWRRFDLPSLRDIARLMRTEHVGLVQTHLAGSAILGTLAGAMLGVPVVATFHGTVDLSPADRWLRLRAAIIRAGTRRVVFVSRSLRDTLDTYLHLSPGVASVVHNGVEVERYGAAGVAQVRALMRAELGAGDDDFIVGALGNLRFAKSYDVLVAATAKLALHVPSLIVAIAGDAPPAAKAALEQQARDLGVLDRLRLVGFRPDVDRFLSALDAFALTSSTEGFSIATVEALASGLPVVATRSGGPEEIVTDGVDGFLVPVRDPDAVADALLRVARDRALRERLGSAGRETVAERFSNTAMVSAYERIYDEVLGGRRGKSVSAVR